MRKSVLIAIACMQFATLRAQQQGTIFYERKVDVHRHIEDEQMKAMVPQFRTTKHELVFSDSISVFKAVKEDEAPDPFDNSGGGGARMIIRMGPGENGVLYKNFKNQQIKEQTEFADKKYIIDDTIHAQPWKLADETKVIAGHSCKKAMMKSKAGNDVIAWYAEDIPTPVGPENYGGLPGAVLAINVNNGEIIYTATVVQNNFSNKELAEPKDGKHITRADFKKKMDDVLGPAGPGGSRVIRM